MGGIPRLEEIPSEYWGNTILFRLALELGYVGEEVDGELTIDVDPDKVLEEALEIIWRYNDLKEDS